MSEQVPGIDDAGHRRWLDDEMRRLLAFGREAIAPGGGAFALDDRGSPRTDQPIEVWITARMVHVYGIAHLLGVPGADHLAEGALAGLLGPLEDTEYGGWYAGIAADGIPSADEKSCYAHAFVLLASSTAVVAGLPRGEELFEKAQSVLLERFWDDGAGMCADTWDRPWTALSGYRGINANMHAVEAMLAAADVSGDLRWADRAARIVTRTVHLAQSHDGRIPEHFDAGWRPDLGFNEDRPADPFKPFGATVGHGLEWSRLVLQLEATLGNSAPPGLADEAVRLFDRAVSDGWDVDGRPGFVYTTGWDGRPVVRTRMHWVVAEAIAAAATLARRTEDPAYARWYAIWWEYAQQFLIDLRGGSWWHELDPANAPSAQTWQGKPDLYHAVQATLLPRLPTAPSIAAAVKAGLLQS